MKLKTETVLTGSKILALMGAIWYTVLFTGQLVTLVSSFINLDWSKHSYQADQNLFNIREHSIGFFIGAMCLNIAVNVLKALIWTLVYQLLSKLKLQTPFTMEVEKRLEMLAFLLFGVWLVSGSFWKLYSYYLSRDMGIQFPMVSIGDEYLFIACIMYIISQIFKRGIEIQEDNDLAV